MKTRFKSILMVCIALTSTFFASCTDDALVEVSNSYADKPFELTVSQNAPESRLELGQDGLKTMWEPGDKLVLVDKTRSLAPIYLTCTLEEKSDKATFVSESGVPSGDYYVIYNYNQNMVYGHKGFQSIEDINEHDDLVLWNELNIAEGVSSATVSLQHMYAKVRIELHNAPYDNMGGQIGIYSSKKGFPIFKQFTSNGLVDAEYGRSPNNLNGNGESTYFPSNRKFHNIRLGYFGSRYNDNGEEIGRNQLSALILPVDLCGEDVFFYVLNGNTCYEIKKPKEDVQINFKAGTSYKIVLDLSKATVSTLSSTYNNDTYETVYQLATAADWRHAAYRNGCESYSDNGINFSNYPYEITQNIDFANECFFPIATSKLIGGGKTLSNISLDWSDEDNIGLIRHEWTGRNEKRELSSSGFFDYYKRVSELTLENVTIKGNNFVGAFGGCNVGVSNCNVIGSSVIEGKGNYVGGLVGANDIYYHSSLQFADVRVGQSCMISGKNYVGGIIGACLNTNYWWDSNIRVSSSVILMESCKSEALVSGTEDYVGGIFGKIGKGYYRDYSDCSIEFSMEDYTYSLIKCVNEGSVSGRHYVGGVGGDFAVTSYNGGSTLDRVVLSQSCSTGKVTGDTKVGGILGSSMATPSICYSTGEISATTSAVGGIVGDFSNGYQARIANCYSLAKLSAGDNAKTGGIVGVAGGGMMGATITNCYYAADPNVYSYGGIVGYSDGASNVSNCLTTLNSLGNNLGDHKIPTGADSDGDGYPDWDHNGDGKYNYDDLYYDVSDVITNSTAAVTSILDNISIINGDNAYSTNIWPIETYPWYCVKFASFSADTDSPDYDEDTYQ